jgi:initiation factor 1A
VIKCILFILEQHLIYLPQGGKNRRRGKNENDDDKRELVFREDGQEYAQVTKMLGNGRLEAQCFDGEKRLAHIRGKMRKKVRAVLPVIVDTKSENNAQIGVDQSRGYRSSFSPGLPG